MKRRALENFWQFCTLRAAACRYFRNRELYDANNARSKFASNEHVLCACAQKERRQKSPKSKTGVKNETNARAHVFTKPNETHRPSRKNRRQNTFLSLLLRPQSYDTVNIQWMYNGPSEPKIASQMQMNAAGRKQKSRQKTEETGGTERNCSNDANATARGVH